MSYLLGELGEGVCGVPGPRDQEGKRYPPGSLALRTHVPDCFSACYEPPNPYTQKVLFITHSLIHSRIIEVHGSFLSTCGYSSEQTDKKQWSPGDFVLQTDGTHHHHK